MKKRSLFLIIAITCLGCNGKGTSDGSKDGSSALNQKELQYFINGKKLYETYCINCHMEEGQGLGRLIPPLKTSDYLMADLGRASRIIKYGQRGPIQVNDIEFNQPMPANPKMTNLEIAEIVTFISNSWGNAAKGFTIEQVEAALKEEQVN